MGKSRNMETQTRPGTKGSAEDVRQEAVPSPSGGKEAAEGLPRGDSVALRDALGQLTERELAIFNAGMSAGAGQQLSQIVQQHTAFVKAATDQANARSTQVLKMLQSLPAAGAVSNGARAGAELGRRVVAAGKALLGKR